MSDASLNTGNHAGQLTEPLFMRTITRRIAFLLMLALFIASFGIAVTGCNTVEGAGEDVGEAGEAIEDAAD